MNLSSFATGVAGGLIAGKQAMNAAKRNEKWDTMMDKIIDKGGPTGPKITDKSTPAADSAPVEGQLPELASTDNPDFRANGGLITGQVSVGELPKHSDTTSWQRRTFKKNQNV